MTAIRDIPVYTVLGQGDLAALIAVLIAMAALTVARRGDLLGVCMAIMMGMLISSYCRYWLQDHGGALGVSLAAAAAGTYAFLRLEVRRVFNAPWARATAAVYGLGTATAGIALVVTDNMQGQLPSWAAFPTILSICCILWAVVATQKGPFLPAD